MNKIRTIITFVFLTIFFSCSPSEDASKQVVDSEIESQPKPTQDPVPEKVERKTGDELTLKCGNWGTFSVKIATNECNSMQCVSWNDKSIVIEQQTFTGSTVIQRKDLTFYGFAMVGGDSSKKEGVCEIVDTSDNIL